MTPRSRKPVMLLGMTNLSSSDPNQSSSCYKSCTSLNEADEDDDMLMENVNREPLLCSVGMPRSKSDGDVNFVTDTKTTSGSSAVQRSGSGEISVRSKIPHDSLTNEFRDYLFSRSVMTTSPADLSFSSQPDDFGSATPDIRDLSESELSESLLYCLDGNRPDDLSYVSDESNNEIPVIVDKENDSIVLNSMMSSSRKRPATKNDNDTSSVTDIDLMSKRVVLEMGETSL